MIIHLMGDFLLVALLLVVFKVIGSEKVNDARSMNDEFDENDDLQTLKEREARE